MLLRLYSIQCTLFDFHSGFSLVCQHYAYAECILIFAVICAIVDCWISSNRAVISTPLPLPSPLLPSPLLPSSPSSLPFSTVKHVLIPVVISALVCQDIASPGEVQFFDALFQGSPSSPHSVASTIVPETELNVAGEEVVGLDGSQMLGEFTTFLNGLQSMQAPEHGPQGYLTTMASLEDDGFIMPQTSPTQ